MSKTRGVLYVHSSPSTLCPHVEWAVGGVLGVPVRLDWTTQPLERGAHRAEFLWEGPVGMAAALASTLRTWGRVRFEVTEDGTAMSESCRYAYTPALGLFHAVTGLHGDIMIPEDRLKHAVVTEALGGRSLLESLDALLGTSWDAELEPFRHAGEGSAVRWLHQVV